MTGGGAALRAVVGCTRLRSSVRERWVRDKVIGAYPCLPRFEANSARSCCSHVNSVSKRLNRAAIVSGPAPSLDQHRIKGILLLSGYQYNKDMFISDPNGGLRRGKELILQIHVCPGFMPCQPIRVAPM